MAQHTTDPSELPPPDSITNNSKTSRLEKADSVLANPNNPAMILDSLLPTPSLRQGLDYSLLRNPRQDPDSPPPEDAIPSRATPSIPKIPSKILRKPSLLQSVHQNPSPHPEAKEKEGGEEEEELARGKKGTKRCCGACRKSVGLVGGFKCRCGGLFCGIHRYSDRHDCSFDYKAAGREAIARENPLVQATKIVKI